MCWTCGTRTYQHLHVRNIVVTQQAFQLLQVYDAGALVQSVEQDDMLDSAVVSFLVIAQERIMAVLTPPEADSPQPLTLGLLQASMLA